VPPTPAPAPRAAGAAGAAGGGGSAGGGSAQTPLLQGGWSAQPTSQPTPAPSSSQRSRPPTPGSALSAKAEAGRKEEQTNLARALRLLGAGPGGWCGVSAGEAESSTRTRGSRAGRQVDYSALYSRDAGVDVAEYEQALAQLWAKNSKDQAEAAGDDDEAVEGWGDTAAGPPQKRGKGSGGGRKAGGNGNAKGKRRQGPHKTFEIPAHLKLPLLPLQPVLRMLCERCGLDPSGDKDEVIRKLTEYERPRTQRRITRAKKHNAAECILLAILAIEDFRDLVFSASTLTELAQWRLCSKDCHDWVDLAVINRGGVLPIDVAAGVHVRR